MIRKKAIGTAIKISLPDSLEMSDYKVLFFQKITDFSQEFFFC
jgi:hypothetical protein